MPKPYSIDRPTGGSAIVVTLSESFQPSSHKYELVEKLRAHTPTDIPRNFLVFDCSELEFVDSRLIRHTMIDAALQLSSDKLLIISKNPNDPELEFLQHLPVSDTINVFQNIVDALVYVHMETAN